MTASAATNLPLSFLIIDWLDQMILPFCINDQALPLALSSTLPVITGLAFPAGSTCTLLFGPMAPADHLRIQAACAAPSFTLTLTDPTGPSQVRCHRTTGTFDGTTLTMTLGVNTPIGYNYGGLAYY